MPCMSPHETLELPAIKNPWRPSPCQCAGALAGKRGYVEKSTPSSSDWKGKQDGSTRGTPRVARQAGGEAGRQPGRGAFGVATEAVLGGV